MRIDVRHRILGSPAGITIMREDELSYHNRRSMAQRALAERAGTPAIAKLHQELAKLHEDRAGQPGGARPTLRIVMPS
jgi:hypothetical protein